MRMKKLIVVTTIMVIAAQAAHATPAEVIDVTPPALMQITDAV